MFNQYLIKRLFIALAMLFIFSCSQESAVIVQEDVEAIAPAVLASNTLPTMDVYKRASCGCCGKWIDHMTANGYSIIPHDMEDLSALKKEKGVPSYYQSCHTAVSAEGYIFEGHIPARIVQQFLNEKPQNVIGLTVPGMPVGSPGMEVGDKFMPYDVLILMSDGTVAKYAHIASQKEQY